MISTQTARMSNLNSHFVRSVPVCSVSLICTVHEFHVCSWSLVLHFIPAVQILLKIDPRDPSAGDTRSVTEEILKLCGHESTPPSVLSYKAPVAGLLVAVAATYMYWRGFM